MPNSALSYGRGNDIGRGDGTGRGGGGIGKGRRRRPYLGPKAKPSTSLGHAWIREEMERVERFSVSGKGIEMN